MFCTARIGRADIEVANRAVDLFLSKAKITLPIRTLGRDNSVIPGVTFQSFPTLIKKVREFARPHFRVWNLLCLRSNQADFCPCTQLRIISFDDSILSILYRQMFLNRMSLPLGAIDTRRACETCSESQFSNPFNSVPPQPNCPPTGVPPKR